MSRVVEKILSRVFKQVQQANLRLLAQLSPSDMLHPASVDQLHLLEMKVFSVTAFRTSYAVAHTSNFFLLSSPP
jgi:hypothetical protein